MKIRMNSLHGDDKSTAYFRKIGIYGFDFVNDKAFATDLSPEEYHKILDHADFYLNMYGAASLQLIAD